MLSKKEHYFVQRNIGMSVIWTVFAIVCLGFAVAPWIIIAIKGQLPRTIAALFLVVWSAFPMALGAYLLFLAWRRVEFLGAPGHIVRHTKWLFWKTEAEYPIDRAYFVRQWHHSKHGDVIRVVIYICSATGKHRLADELMCRDLPGLMRWIADVTRVKVLDVRHRAPVDI